MTEKTIRKAVCCALCALIAAPAVTVGAWAKQLVPVGRAVGIEIKTDGMLIAALSKVKTAQGECSPAADAGLRAGDIVVRLGGQRIVCAEDFAAASGRLDGGQTTVTVLRAGRLIQYGVSPAQSVDGGWRLGFWLRDGAAGIGTVTFYDPETGAFGALGHSICDADTGVVLPVAEGSITQASVTGVKKGESGVPGELQGAFDTEKSLGGISSNTAFGIFGTASEGFDGSAVETAKSAEITDGPAQILATVSGSQAESYEVEISRVYRGGEEKLVICVTDERLLEATGGIVQGMSGCPIIQNGKLVGAVTHVLLSDPTRGYGVPIEGMLACERAAADAA